MSEEKLNKITSDLSSVLDTLREQSSNIKELSHRVKSLEDHSSDSFGGLNSRSDFHPPGHCTYSPRAYGVDAQREACSPVHDVEQNGSTEDAAGIRTSTLQPTQNTVGTGGVLGPAVNNNSAPQDYQATFQTIADSVSRIQLPPDLCVKSTRQGLSKEAQTSMNIVSKCAKHAEVTLKCISQMVPGNVSEQDLNTLVSIQTCQVKFLQDEVANLVVQSQFDPTTTRMFRSLQRNASVFSPSTIQNLEHAVSISAASARQDRGRPGSRGARRGTGTSRGSYRDPYYSMFNSGNSRPFGRGQDRNNTNRENNGNSSSEP